MSATVFLDDQIDDTEQIECEEVRVIGELVWATPEDGERETVIPLSNVRGIEGDVIEQEVEEIESTGGRFAELITDLS